MPIRVAAIDDHPLILKAVVQELESQDDIQVVGTAAHESELQALVREMSPNVVVLDLGMSTVLKSDALSLCLPEGIRRVCAGGRFYSPSATERHFARDSDQVLASQEIDLLNLVARAAKDLAQ